MMTTPILDIRDLCVSYGKVEALHHVNLKVEAGKIVTVIGPNGAGKTTMLGAIMGLLPSKGEIQFQDEVQRDIEVEHLVAMGMTLV
ncbi:MAG: ATP-binding cassette domain-containing protein, partial [Rhodocyclaceae bacterium]|nr:ATP-binding cassette domain-containing protein [Rhodocyclaceae bacterium]